MIELGLAVARLWICIIAAAAAAANRIPRVLTWTARIQLVPAVVKCTSENVKPSIAIATT